MSDELQNVCIGGPYHGQRHNHLGKTLHLPAPLVFEKVVDRHVPEILPDDRVVYTERWLYSETTKIRFWMLESVPDDKIIEHLIRLAASAKG